MSWPASRIQKGGVLARYREHYSLGEGGGSYREGGQGDQKDPIMVFQPREKPIFSFGFF